MSPKGDKGANLCGTTPVPRLHAALVRAVTGTPGEVYYRVEYADSVRGSQVMFAGSAPPPSHHAGGSLRGFNRLLVLFKALWYSVRSLGDGRYLYYRREANLSTVFQGKTSQKGERPPSGYFLSRGRK